MSFRPIPKTKRIKRGELDATLWKWFSEYIRRSHANHAGYVQCYTCDKYLHWKESHAGHFISRGKLPTKYDERNVKPQCPHCNNPAYGAGESGRFAIHIDKDYGYGTAELISNLSRQRGFKFHSVWIQEKLDYYKPLVLELRSKMGDV